jgi:beta-N-acetylhexosaminidase
MRGTVTRWRRAGVTPATALLTVAVLLAGCGGGSSGSDGTGEEATTGPGGATTASDGGTGPAAGLTEEQLIDQVILAGFDGSDPGSDIVGEVADHQLGGVLIASSNWKGAGPGKKLIAAILDAGSKDGAIPPLIATAQEGGPYRALSDLPRDQREVEIGDRGDPKLAEQWGEDAAKALHDVGIDLDLAPVADVATLDSPIADRAFSDDPAVAAEMTAAAVRGCEHEDVACAPSHFPGLGAAAQDTDEGPTSVGLDAATLENRDLVPFTAAFDAGAPAAVISHAFYALDPVVPASLSRAVSTDLLRDTAGFDGVAISDDLGAGAITAVMTPPDAAVQALNAGIDLLQVADPGDVEPVRRALKAAVADGKLSEERLREAAGRVLALKKSLVG